MQRALMCTVMLSPGHKLPVLVYTCVCGCIGVRINVRVKTCIKMYARVYVLV